MTAKLKAPEGVGAVSFNGEQYEVVKGVVEVPAEAAADFVAHGFEPVVTEGKKAK